MVISIITPWGCVGTAGEGGVPGAGEQFRDKNASLAPPRNERFSVPEIRKKL